jgi:hypothetical protein
MCDLNNAIPLIALVTSIVSVVIALAALMISREKLRMDLYNRRFEIFRAAVNLRNLHCEEWTRSDAQLEVRSAFFRALEEAGFLFKEGSGVIEVLNRMHLASQFIVRHEPPSQPGYPDDEQRRYVEDKVWITDGSIRELRENIAPFLNFKTLTEWPGIE